MKLLQEKYNKELRNNMFKKKENVVETIEEPTIKPEVKKVTLNEINDEIEIEKNEKSEQALKDIIMQFLALSHEDRRIVIDKIKNGKI